MSAQPQQTYAATDGYELAIAENIRYADNQPSPWTRRTIAMIADMRAESTTRRITNAARPSSRI